MATEQEKAFRAFAAASQAMEKAATPGEGLGAAIGQDLGGLLTKFAPLTDSFNPMKVNAFVQLKNA